MPKSHSDIDVYDSDPFRGTAHGNSTLIVGGDSGVASKPGFNASDPPVI